MSATYQTVLELARTLPGVIEGRAYGTPSLHVGRKLMVRLWEDGETLVAGAAREDRAGLLHDLPDVFFLTDHYREYPRILVRLPHVTPEQLREILERSWRLVASRRQIVAREAAASA